MGLYQLSSPGPVCALADAWGRGGGVIGDLPLHGEAVVGQSSVWRSLPWEGTVVGCPVPLGLSSVYSKAGCQSSREGRAEQLGEK